MQTKPEQKTYTFGKTQQQPREQTVSSHHMPAKSFRSGSMSVAIWDNETVNAQGEPTTYQTVTFERRYKDKQTGEWKTSNNLRANDLPKAALLLNKAYEYLVLTGTDEDEIY